MGKNRRSACAYSALVVVVLTMTTCDAFKAGLGPKIDIASPTVSVSSLANGSYVKGTVNLTGAVADDVTVQSVSVTVSINGTTYATITPTVTGGSWSAPLDTVAIYGNKEAKADLAIVVKDGSGKTKEDDLVLYFDNVIPEITSLSPTAEQLATTDYALSETSKVSISVLDTYLSSVVMKAGEHDEFQFSDSSHKSPCTFLIDTKQFYDASTGEAKPGVTKNNGTGIYSVPYWIVATDLAGNESVKTVGKFYVNPDGSPIVDVNGQTDSVKPEILFPNTTPQTASNIVAPGSTIKFRVFDMDGLDTSDEYFFAALAPGKGQGDITLAPSDLSGVKIYTVSSGLTQTSLDKIKLVDGSSIPTRADYSFKVPTTLGEYMLLIRATDYKGNKISGQAASRYLPSIENSKYRYTSIFISNSDPTVTVLAPAEGAYSKALNASGTIADEMGVEDVKLAIVDGSGQALPSSPFTIVPNNVEAASSDWAYAPSPALSDGPYKLTFTAYNALGQKGSGAVTRNIVIDTTPPTVSISMPNPSLGPGDSAYWLSGTTAAFSGTPSDAGAGVASVYYKITVKGAAAPVFSASDWTLASLSTKWSSTVDLSSLGEGQFTLNLVALDSLGNQSPLTSCNFGVDQASPTVTETHPASFAAKAQYALAGALSDGNEISGIAITEKKNGGSARTVGLTTTPTSLLGAKSATYSSVLLPLDGVSDGSYEYSITVADLAGKTSHLTRVVNIDTTDPNLTLSAIPSWVSASAYTIGGGADDPNAGASGVSAVTYALDGGSATATAWTDNSGGANTSGTWKATLTGLAEGAHSLIAAAVDAAGNSRALAPVSFGVDLNPPNLTVNAAPSVVTAANASSFAGFSGYAWDSNALAPASALTVSYTRNGGGATSEPITVSGGSRASPGNPWAWNFAVDSSGHTTDGIYVFTFTATDAAGKTATSTQNLTIDTTAPTATVTSPAASAWLSSTALTVTGSASDGAGTGVSAVYVKADAAYVASGPTDHSGEDPTSASGWKKATGTTSWSASVALSGEGEKTLWIKTVDAAGNATTPIDAVSGRVAFGYDANPPALTETLVNTTDTQYSSTDLNFGGLASDTNALSSLTVSVNSGAAQGIVVNGGTHAWTYDFDGASRTEGSYSLSFTATDVAGKATTLARTVLVDKTKPTLSAPTTPVAYIDATVTLMGTASDLGASASGVQKLQYQVGSTTGTWYDADGTTNWSKTIDLSAQAEGAATVYFRAQDKAGLYSDIGSTVVNVDHAAPQATESNHTNALIQSKSDVVLAGRADDAARTPLRAAASAVLSWSKDGGSVSNEALTVDPDGADNVAGNADDGSWTWTLPADPHSNGDHSADGLYTITLTVTDLAGKIATVTRTVQIDTTPPTLAVSAPVGNEATANNNYPISGTSRDTGGVGFSGTADVEYKLSTSGTWLPLTLTGTSWGATAALGGVEGAKTLNFRSKDKLSNVATQDVSFYYDLNPPTLTETKVNSTDTQYAKADLSFGGTASDTNALSSLTVRVNLGAATSITVDAGNNWNYDFGAGSLADGTYSLLFMATDAANKTTSVTRTVVVDKTLPTVSAIAVLSGWRTSATQSLSGSASDLGSGLDRVEYRVGAGAWSNFTGTASFAGAVSFAEGSNTLSIRAVDKAGNFSLPVAADNSQQTVLVDTNDPTLDITSPTTSPILNGQSSLSITVNAADAAGGSGLSSVSAYTYDASTLPNPTTGAPHTMAASGSSATLTLVMPAADLLALTEGTRRIYVKATDAAGRSSTLNMVNLLVDKTAPTVSIGSQAENAVVNKTIDVGGAAGDANGIASCVLQVYDASASAWVPAPSGTASGTTAWSLSGFDTTAISAASATYDSDPAVAGLQLRLRAVATDAAGNTASAPRTLTIDQNSDRPVIKLTNLPTLDGTTTLKMSRTVFGTVSDDDGAVTKLEASEDGAAWAELPLDGGTWSRDASAGDGTKYLYFRVTDAMGTVFTTDTGPTETVNEPRIWLTAAPTYGHDRVTFKVDTVAPEFASTSPILVDKTGTDFSDAVDLANNMAFGGTSAQFALRVLASDANGIATVKVTVPGATGSPFSADPKGADVAQPAFTRFDTGTINVGAVADGSMSVTVEVTDNSGLKSTATRTIVVDNTAPTVNFINPSTAAIVNGDLDITGTAADSGSGLSSVTYRVGLNYASEGASTPGGTKFLWDIPYVDAAAFHASAESFDDTSTGAHIYVLPIVVRATDNAGNVRETVPLTGAGASRPSSTTLQSASLAAEPARSLVKAGQALLVGANARIITDFNPTTGTVTWAGAVPVAEAAYSIFEYCLRVNPNADLPVAAVSYPSNGSTMGGNVRMYGTAIDDDGVSEVWMEIDTNGDGLFNAADDAIGGWFNGDSGKKVDGSANWNQTINQAHEFDPTGSTPTTINVRVRAKDIYGTWGPWTAPTMVLIDKNVPQIGSSVGLYLESAADSSIKVPYTFGMCVKGNWTLKGSVEDDGAISAIELGGSIGGSYALNPGWFSEVTPSTSSPGKYKRVDLQIPITSVANSSGALAFTISAYDDATPSAHETIQSLRVTYDNQAPSASLIAPTTDSSLVAQSNGWYKIKGSTEDTGSDIDRVEVYFVRRGNGTTTFDRIYNPAVANKSASLSSITIDADGSPLKGGTASARTSTSLTDAALAGNPLINLGQKVVVGSLVRTISAYAPATGRIDWNDGDVDTALTAYSIRLAIQIDDKSTEVRDSGTGLLTTDDGDGYLEYLKQDNGNAYTWYVDINSANIPDGPIEIHWVTYDKAGNASRGSTPAKPATGYYKVQNNGPRVASIQLGTDLDGSGVIEAGEQLSFPYSSDSSSSETIAAAFKVVGKMSLLPVVTNGNGDLVVNLTAGGYSASGIAFRTSGVSTPISLSDADVTTVGQGARTFVMTIWDSTEETVPGTDSLSIVRGATCTVANIDGEAPKAVVSPFYWNGAGDNSLYANSRANGHIEINGVYDGVDPDVSGQVSVRGTAYDDQRIANIWMYIGDGTTDTNRFAFTGASATKVFGGLTYAKVATYNTAATPGPDKQLNFVVEGNWATNGWRFNLVDSVFSQTSHQIKWRLDWDSSRISGVAATNRVIRVEVEDRNPNASLPSATASADPALNNQPSYQVDVVPYVTGIATQLSSAYSGVPSSLNRSARGWYPLQNGEQVTLNGFNFNGASTVVTVNGVPQTVATTATPLTSVLATVGAGYAVTASTATHAFTTALTHGMEANTRVSFAATTMPTGLVAGTLYYVVGSSLGPYSFQVSAAADGAAINFTTNGTAVTVATMSGDLAVLVGGYKSINNSDSDIESNQEPNGLNNNGLTDDRRVFLWQFTSLVANTGVRFPSMRVGSDAAQTIGFVYDSGAQYVRMNVGGSDYQIDQSYTQWYDTAVGIDAYGYPYGFSMNGDSGGTGNQSGVGGGHANGEFYAWNTTGAPGSNYNTNNGAYSDGTKKVAIENSFVSPTFDSTRILEPKIATYATSATNVSTYMSYYDNIDGQVRYRYGTVTGTYPTPTFGGNNVSHNNVASGSGAGYQVVASGATTFQAGKYSAIGVSPTGARAYAAWYDANARRLVFSYNTSPTTASQAQWQTNAKYIDGAFTGWYVDMAVDAADHIHLAYYNSSTGDLKYAYLDTYTSAPVVVTVDSWLSVGSNVSIAVKYDGTNYVPYISYYMGSYDQTQFSNRLAYRTNFGSPAAPADGASADMYTGNWEVQTIPTPNIPKNYRVGVGIKNAVGGAPNSAIVGYATDAGIETAQLR